jgi:hypothetical protein
MLVKDTLVHVVGETAYKDRFFGFGSFLHSGAERGEDRHVIQDAMPLDCENLPRTGNPFLILMRL